MTANGRRRLPGACTTICAALAAAGWMAVAAPAFAQAPPRPLLAQDKPVDWWFVFKFNSSKSFAGCGESAKQRTCRFGGEVQAKPAFGQQFVFASNGRVGGTGAVELKKGQGCLGTTLDDPVGATFDQVYNGTFNYLIWNDQFYNDPAVKACKGNSCGEPWGHSKGLLAWNDAGDGFVMQVSTPGWPRAGSKAFKKRRVDKGNTLGCVSSSNNLLASQHFFALRLDRGDLIKVLDGLKNASVVTDPTVAQIVKNGGPEEIQRRVNALGKRDSAAERKKDKEAETVMVTELLSGKVTLISKPSSLHVPPWQLVSSLLSTARTRARSNAAERAATWWTKPWIPTTTKDRKVQCWDKAWVKSGKEQLPTDQPGPVEIAVTGAWDGKELELAAPRNHAKIGTATAGDKNYAIFGDLNQQGALSPDCDKSQNARGGLFFAVADDTLFTSVKDLIHGDTASIKAPASTKK